jgi:hypothetical protein
MNILYKKEKTEYYSLNIDKNIKKMQLLFFNEKENHFYSSSFPNTILIDYFNKKHREITYIDFCLLLCEVI